MNFTTIIDTFVTSAITTTQTQNIEADSFLHPSHANISLIHRHPKTYQGHLSVKDISSVSWKNLESSSSSCRSHSQYDPIAPKTIPHRTCHSRSSSFSHLDCSEHAPSSRSYSQSTRGRQHHLDVPHVETLRSRSLALDSTVVRMKQVKAVRRLARKDDDYFNYDHDNDNAVKQMDGYFGYEIEDMYEQQKYVRQNMGSSKRRSDSVPGVRK
ncbi:hypothetical protein FBU30_006308 [Linnemannia zychae]|nr:hypothetical protein FBU30_006308 [Linnemannia zychae]